MRVLTAEEMRAADAHTIETLGVPVLTLMERAGAGVAAALRARFEPARGCAVTLLCGRGNNGGDGMVAARHLRKAGCRPTVLLLGRAKDLAGPNRTNWARLEKAGVPRFEVADETALARHAKKIQGAELLVDAILGTGARGPLEGVVLAACRAMNAVPAPRVAADVPTGVDATTGEAQAGAVRAELTVTFAFPKPGHLLHPGRAFCGSVEVVDIGIPEAAIPGGERRLEAFAPSDAAALMPRRAPTAHKGDMGRVRIVGGGPGMLGAPALAARAALRAGAGLVTVCVPHALYEALAPLLLEATAALHAESAERTHTGRAAGAILVELEHDDALALGPGLTRHPEAAELARALVAKARVPMVVDADGLNAFEGRTELLARAGAPVVITPHAGEFARLAGLSRGEVERARLELATDHAKRWNVTVMLKGAPTVVAAPDGRVRLNPTGNAGMATGGSGDVLTGVLVALLGRGLSAFDAASLAAFLHGLAGDLARDELGEESLVAGDLVAHLPGAFLALREPG
ncbi:MAG: NAD(P)H-hydrate dehydratase [Candidatus Eisenbacteria bacterium]|nr:NAD(P)H-hydrate dehydratase [Candidatus Eisenbacteria bacterium]